MKKNISVLILIIFLSGLSAQEKLKGKVLEASTNSEEIALSGANVYWLNSSIGTITNTKGEFEIPFSGEFNDLIISYVGYKTDTLSIATPNYIKHGLQPTNELEEVVVAKEKETLQKSLFAAQNTVTVSSEELLKAACCNLSESFETNPAIDVNFNDALTATKQIRMLGLTSPYLMITEENIPMIRGASQAYGLSFTPGTWIESIQITKGAGSVVNGFESISGQINTELVKPLLDYPLFINGYANANGRFELNTHVNKKLSEQWSTGLYLHGNLRTEEIDNNNDGFLDVPLAKQVNVLNRWQYQNAEKGWVSFFNVRYLNDQKQVGEVAFEPEIDQFTTNAWGSEIDTERFDTSVKLGYVFPDLPFQSIGLQGAYSRHQQESYFGFNTYTIDHESMYANVLFQSIIGSTISKFKTGINIAYDRYNELVIANEFGRIDRSLGGFFEYSYNDFGKVNFTAGLRFDTHNRLGNFITPRMHLRYTPISNLSLRASFGIGNRAANIFAENQRMFASSRTIQLLQNGGAIYGFNPEKAYNYGVNMLYKFKIFQRFGDFSIDYYRTDFENQVVVDWENPQQVVFSNLSGESYARSFQVEFNYEVFPRLKMRAAYKNYDVKTDFQTGLLQQPLQAQHRYFLNLEYNTAIKENGAQWRFDYTLHALGKQRLPNTSTNPSEFQLPEFVDSYSLMSTQITKVFSKTFEIYLGGENLTNFNQENPVISANDPFGTYFDTSIVYAPILGRMLYVGFRFKS